MWSNVYECLTRCVYDGEDCCQFKPTYGDVAYLWVAEIVAITWRWRRRGLTLLDAAANIFRSSGRWRCGRRGLFRNNRDAQIAIVAKEGRASHFGRHLCCCCCFEVKHWQDSLRKIGLTLRWTKTKVKLHLWTWLDTNIYFMLGFPNKNHT